MCAYVDVYPFWFFQHKADLAGTAEGAPISYTITDSGPPVFDTVAGGDGGGVAQIVGNKVYCKYDYSWESPVAGPNCCEGTYTATVTTCVTNPAPTTCTVSSSLQTWGGQYGNCASGPAADSKWGARDKIHNYPMGKIFAGYGGVAQAVQIPAPAKLGPLNSDMYSANYVKNTPPAALTDVSIVQPEIGPSYVFICLNNNQEAIARIDLTVRKWDTFTEILKQQNGNPEVYGPETPFPGDKLDYYGWDDLVTGASLQYPGGDL